MYDVCSKSGNIKKQHKMFGISIKEHSATENSYKTHAADPSRLSALSLFYKRQSDTSTSSVLYIYLNLTSLVS